MINTVVVVVGLCVLAVILLVGMVAKMFRKAGPNEAIIVSAFADPGWSRDTAR